MSAKITLLDMILYHESEASALEAWAKVADSDATEELYQRKAMIARKTVETLDLVLKHRDAFAEIVRGNAK
jgi:hypothetical protein